MRSLRPVLLAAQVLAAGLGAVAAEGLQFQGGSGDDKAFAWAAAGLKRGEVPSEAAFQTALEAIRRTDRFRAVVAAAPDQVLLDPWPTVARITWQGDAPAALRRTLCPELHKGDRIGAHRLETLRAQAEERMVAAGYPQARVTAVRRAGDAEIVLAVQSGPPNRIMEVQVLGRISPYKSLDLAALTKVEPGRTLWTREFELECLRRLRRRMVSDKRFESRVDLAWEPGGVLHLQVEAGPVVRLKSEGSGLGLATSLKEMVPLSRADRYSPELLDEGERRLVRLFRSRGHLEPQVSYKREVVRTGPDGPEEVLITYTLKPGPKSKIGSFSFEGNASVGEAELRKAAESAGGLWAAKARPEAMDAIESRLEGLYESKGFPQVKIHRQVEQVNGRANLHFRIREGRQRLISWARLELPPGGFGDPWGLGNCLPLLFSDQPQKVAEKEGGKIVFHTDRPGLAGVEGVLERTPVPGGLHMILRFSRPIPLLKSNLANVYTALRQQHLVALGVLRPVVNPQAVEEDGVAGLRIEVPDRPLETMSRLVVQGVDRTRARAVLREFPLGPGDPLDQDKLSRAQGRLGSLGAFQRVDLASLAEPDPTATAPAPAVPGEMGPPSPWKAGDLVLRAQERSPWVVTNSFGYDRTQGYYLGMGVQRLNVGGMGRTLDFDIRAGDGTIHNPTLRDLFSTGQYTESLNSYSVAYTDPWFAPGRLGEMLPDRTGFRTEGAYILEERYIYQLHRRRVLASLNWPVVHRINIEAGYRFERVEVASNVPGISADELGIIAHYPPRAIISAPYVQVVRDTRDNAFDPTRGTFSQARFEVAGQFLGTSDNSSFLKLDLRNQWTWPLGYKAGAGVVAFGMRIGIARPTANSSENLPLSERFFGGGAGTMRGVEPGLLGHLEPLPLYGPDGLPTGATQLIPLGGQAMAIANLEYRFPLFSQKVWGELFVDTGQVYERLKGAYLPDSTGTLQYNPASFPPLRTALGLGLIFKIGIPLKLEYAADVNRVLGRPRSENDVNSQLKNVMVSAGFQF